MIAAIIFNAWKKRKRLEIEINIIITRAAIKKKCHDCKTAILHSRSMSNRKYLIFANFFAICHMFGLSSCKMDFRIVCATIVDLPFIDVVHNNLL